MAEYAKTTTVSPEQSRMELERLLVSRYKVSGYSYSMYGDEHMVTFKYQGSTVRLKVPMPKRTDPAITKTQHKTRSLDSQNAAYNQAVRQRWRMLLLWVKANLEAVDLGLTTVEKVFLADTMLSNGYTVAEHVLPEMQRQLAAGEPVRVLALPAPAGRGD